MKVDSKHPFYPKYLAFKKIWLRFSLGMFVIAWGLGFIRYFNHWVFFPVFPNIFDSIGMSLIGIYLIYDAIKHAKW